MDWGRIRKAQEEYIKEQIKKGDPYYSRLHRLRKKLISKKKKIGLCEKVVGLIQMDTKLYLMKTQLIE